MSLYTGREALRSARSKQCFFLIMMSLSADGGYGTQDDDHREHDNGQDGNDDEFPAHIRVKLRCDEGRWHTGLGLLRRLATSRLAGCRASLRRCSPWGP